MTLQGEILQALNSAGWKESVEAVKTTVRNALRSMDRSAAIEDTGYFNHSFVPDFVLRWEKDASRTREVFLRMDTSAAFLLGDLRYLRSTEPLLLGLTDVEAHEDPQLVAAIEGGLERSGDVLLTEPDVVEHFAERATTADFGQVLPSALLKGGCGLVDEKVAKEISTAASGFFSASRSHDAEPIESAIPTLSAHLNQSQNERLLRLGRVIWEATGGEPTAFPVATDLAGVDDDGLRFLLDEAPGDDPDFWRAVGRSVTLERLLSLGVREGTNFTAFIRSNGDRLLARHLLVKADQQSLDYAGPTWSNESGGLILRGSDFAAYLASRREDLAVDSDKSRGLDLPTFRARTADEVVELVTVIDENGKRVVIEHEHIDPQTDAVLASVGDLPGMRVASVGLSVAGKHLDCDFESRTASGHTSATFDILSLLEHGLPTLWQLHDSRDTDEIALMKRLSTRRADEPQLALFDPDEGYPPDPPDD